MEEPAPQAPQKLESGNEAPIHQRAISFFKEVCRELVSPTTWIGAFMFVLYHVVFCLASGSAITRPHAKNSVLGLMTKMAALGIIFSAPVYLHNIGNGIPSMYPTCDLFLAPLFASIAKIVDEELAQDPTLADDQNDEIFLATFAFLAFIGMLLAGSLLILAGIFRLANLGAFLPFPVLCGFFSAVGILTWHLGFTVDTSGKSFSAVFFSGDTSLMLCALTHHLPGILVAVIMKYLGPKNPFFVVVVVFVTIASAYGILFATGTSLDEAREEGWFWRHEDIVYEGMAARIGFSKWLPPAPCGMVNGLLLGKVHFPSVWKGLQPACALSCLYLVRCALHSAALLKNIPNLGRTITSTVTEMEEEPTIALPRPRKKTRMENFSEAVDIEEVYAHPRASSGPKETLQIERAPPCTWTLQRVMIQYGLAQVVSAFVGGFGVIPSVATSHAMFSLRAERVAPQLGSVVLISIFYLTDFRLIAYVPKLAFSCLLSLAFIDIILTWFIRSYFKTRNKVEWLVCPAIVIFAFGVNLLKAVFFGIGLSTFLFVGAFFRSGVVKFAASGKQIRSTIERPAASAHWLDGHGDLIQLLIVHNFLFFGNASSMLEHVASVFEETGVDGSDCQLLPLPKFVVIDMALVTGMDTSSVDVISDVVNLCDRNDCKVFLSGMSANLRSVLAHAGVKPLSGERSKRKLRFFNSLDAAIGKAEDMLLDMQEQEKPPSSRRKPSSLGALGEESGFHVALRYIDEQHGTNFAKDLARLEDYTTPIELAPNDSLYNSPSRPERGLFFIEEGILKIERDSTLTANTRSKSSLSPLKMRSMGDSTSMGQANGQAESEPLEKHNFRLARFGVGWVIGTIEAAGGLENAGVHLAVTACRLHYISYSRMEELDKADPGLSLFLYKMLSNMMAKRQELTIGQLEILHAIISSPAQCKPIGRRASLAFKE